MMVSIFIILLSVSCDALRLHANSRQIATEPGNGIKRDMGNNSTVLGATMIDDAEMRGERPLFVDAFYDDKTSVAHVVLNMRPFISLHVASKQREAASLFAQWGTHTHWTCEWSDHSERFSRDFSPTYSVQGYTNVQYFPEKGNLSKANSSRTTISMTLGTPASVNMPESSPFLDSINHWDFYHWAMVVSCPMKAGSLTASLSLRAEQGNNEVYKRKEIPVRVATHFQKDVDYALCTMLNRNSRSEAEYLRPWAQYHLKVGFQKLLIYVEEKNTTWVEEALNQFIKQDKVTILPFYFGKISDTRKNQMQGAMEHHCLYQAKGKATWLAHNDIDEYFDFIGDQFHLSQHFPRVQSDEIAFAVQSQFWGSNAINSPTLGLPFPCNLACKAGQGNEYFPAGKRSKNIIKPQHVLAIFPHALIHEPHYRVIIPDPVKDLRVNHFKQCRTDGDGCYANVCSEDFSFQDRCKAMLAD